MLLKLITYVALLAACALGKIHKPTGTYSSTEYPPQAITSLPGWNGYLPEMMGGYIETDAAQERFDYFWFVEYEGGSEDPTTPLFVWYQGGPGCSGLYGMWSEVGPWLLDDDNNVVERPTSLNKLGHILFLEQPAGVGFSFANTVNGLKTNDTSATINNFNFLENWLVEFPQYQSNPISLIGESYGGWYIPSLASLIADNSDSYSAASLANILVGNPVWWCESDNYNDTQIGIFYHHQLISYETYADWQDNDCADDPSSYYCMNVMANAYGEIGRIVQEGTSSSISTYGEQPVLDPDDLYQDFLLGNATLDFSVTQPTGTTVDLRIFNYLNRADVQKAINARPTEWESCADIDYTIQAQSLTPFYLNLINKLPEVGVLIYSGDVDMATCPAAHTEVCMQELGGNAVNSWHPYFMPNGAAAGYTAQYDTFTYATVKGAGHEVPAFQPYSSYQMIKRFVETGVLDDDESELARVNLAAAGGRKFKKQGEILRSYRGF